MKPSEDQIFHAMKAAETAAQDQISFLMVSKNTFAGMSPAQAEAVKYALRHYARLGARAGVLQYSAALQAAKE